MNWFLPPTDNLYKFCAISGLMVMVCPLAGLLYLLDYASELSAKTGLAINKTTIEVHFAGQELKSLEKEVEEVSKRVEQGDSSVSIPLEKLQTDLRNLRKNSKDVKIRIAEDESEHGEAGRYIRWATIAIIPAFLFLWGGMKLATFGFTNWYGLTKQLEEKEK